ncbi:hypothetical protein [Bradyrhizobium sp. Ai1a-2]|uniref:hypothetical protein n=1 Tax=Bradyrhizobium sp. Ai1a-2 TaxID=196490 RepID=UPI0004104783|nr:hypothetical protein [Bradyrhizobium sp. Ai1a-2]
MRDDVIRNDHNGNDQMIERPEPHRGNEYDGATNQCAERLKHCCEDFTNWFGKKYDLDVLKAELAVCAAEKLPGDPAWLMIISGSGNAKTETVQATSGLDGVRVVSSISSIGALLSGAKRGRDATGGLLIEIGERGILVVKDFTSILTMDRTQRGLVLSAFREIHDGYWVRDVGEGGGRKLTWRGRVVVIAACTTAWDQAHTVIASMGDRFVYIRPDSNVGRIEGGRCAIGNTGIEANMREGLAEAVLTVIDGTDLTRAELITEEDQAAILEAANVVTLARTAVEIDYRGNVIDAHAPEMPTRLAKQLTQIMRGALAIGLKREEALALVLRCARDSMPPLRLAVLLDVSKYPDTPIIETRRRVQKPRTTVDRVLQCLHILGLLTCREEEVVRGNKTEWKRNYSLADNVNLTALFPA